jgi:hypothetical protein
MKRKLKEVSVRIVRMDLELLNLAEIGLDIWPVITIEKTY